MWDADSGDHKRTIKASTGRIWAIGFHPGGGILASAGDDASVQLWEPATWRRLATLYGHADRVLTVAFSPDGSLLASGGDDGTVRLWDVRNPQSVPHHMTLIGKPDGWAAVGAHGRYKLHGSIGHEFWHVIGTCRFEPGELDPYVSEIGMLPMAAPFDLAT